MAGSDGAVVPVREGRPPTATPRRRDRPRPLTPRPSRRSSRPADRRVERPPATSANTSSSSTSSLAIERLKRRVGPGGGARPAASASCSWSSSRSSASRCCARRTWVRSRLRPLRKAAATQQVQTVTIPAPRGAITDRKRRRARGQRGCGPTSSLTPYLIKKPPGGRAAALPAARQACPGRAAAGDQAAHRVRLPGAPAGWPEGETRLGKLNIAGITLIPVEPRREYPRACGAAVAGARQRRLGEPAALSGPRVQVQTPCCAGAERASARSSATRSGSRSRSTDVRTTRPGKTLQLDDRRGGSRTRSSRCSRASAPSTSRRVRPRDP